MPKVRTQDDLRTFPRPEADRPPVSESSGELRTSASDGEQSEALPSGTEEEEPGGQREAEGSKRPVGLKRQLIVNQWDDDTFTVSFRNVTAKHILHNLVRAAEKELHIKLARHLI